MNATYLSQTDDYWICLC